VVHGDDGSDEITPVAATTMVEVCDGRALRRRVEPEDLGITRCGARELAGGDAAANAATIRALLAGEPGPKADAVALNAGAALYVAGIASDLRRGVEVARDVLAGGRASGVLEALAAFDGELRT